MGQEHEKETHRCGRNYGYYLSIRNIHIDSGTAQGTLQFLPDATVMWCINKRGTYTYILHPMQTGSAVIKYCSRVRPDLHGSLHTITREYFGRQAEQVPDNRPTKLDTEQGDLSGADQQVGFTISRHVCFHRKRAAA